MLNRCKDSICFQVMGHWRASSRAIDFRGSGPEIIKAGRIVDTRRRISAVTVRVCGALLSQSGSISIPPTVDYSSVVDSCCGEAVCDDILVRVRRTGR
jgi:hypothetical protein